MKKHIALLVILITITSCGIVRQSKEIKALSRCEFSICSVSDIKLAGIRIDERSDMNDFSFMDFAKLTSSMASGDLPLKFDVNLMIDNPNAARAALNELEWILFIDEQEITQGELNKRLEIPAMDSRTVPVKINLNILKIMTGNSANAVINFAMNLSGQSQDPSKVTLKAKPSIYIAGRAVAYPGWIEIETGM